MVICKRKLAANLLSLSGLGPVIRRHGMWRGLMALAYHRVGDGRDSLLDRSLFSVTADDFHAQVAFLKKYFDVIPPADIAAALRSRRGRYVLITFDDGYRDNYEIAFPILKSQGVPATFFVTTAFLDHRLVSWWDEIAWMVRTSPRTGIPAGPWLPAPLPFDEPDRQQAVARLLDVYRSVPWDQGESFLDSLAEATGSGRCEPSQQCAPWMTWEMLRRMRAAGMTIGGHTTSHRILARLPAAEQQREIAGCAARLEAELGEPMRCFSYPEGLPGTFNGQTRVLLETHGLEYAFSHYGQLRTFDDWDPYDIPRVGVELQVGLDLFRAILTLPHVFA
jgi:peptidoglycan/xylan/chitin deacetylase (PgdA/CDA1 family)